MQIQPVGLPIEVVPSEFQPIETFIDRIERHLRVPLNVGIIDAQNNCAALMAGIEPVEDEGSSAAYVKVARGRWRKAHACHTSSSKE
jgi:hypothetical protein